MKIHNIKCSYYFSDNLIPKQKTNTKVIDKVDGRVTTTIYKHTPNLVNCTGLKHREQIYGMKHILEKKYGAKCTHCRIDNTFIQQKWGIRLNLVKVYEVALTHYKHIYTVSYQPELFSGLCMKAIKKSYPTINIFSTGTVQFLGGKTFQCIQESEEIVKNIISECKIQ